MTVLSFFFVCFVFVFDSIPDYDDAQDRFVEVVRWYVSAFHAGRQVSNQGSTGRVIYSHWRLKKSLGDYLNSLRRPMASGRPFFQGPSSPTKVCPL